jgi:hypothetical protein
MKTFGWLGVGALVLVLAWDAPSVQAQAPGAYSPNASTFSPAGGFRRPSLTTNYYNLVRTPTGVQQNGVGRSQLYKHRQQVVRRAPADPQAIMGNIPGFMTIGPFYQRSSNQPKPVSGRKPYRRY